jgi:TRAP-type mannitol/chloroaromatic compound transport system permease small subunit
MHPRLRALERLAYRLETLSEHTGRAVSWLVLALVALVGYDVAMRYVFRAGSVAAQELEWHLFALIFLLGAAYALKHDAHVRVDMLYQRLDAQGRAWVDLAGSLLFLLPFCLIMIATSVPFAYAAFLYGEGSPDPGGLPHRFLIKSAIPAGFALLALQGLAQALRSLLAIAQHRRRVPPHPPVEGM